MHNRLVIIGAGGHGKVIADIALKNHYREILFVDDNIVGKCMGFPIIGPCDLLNLYDDGNTDFVVAVGNNYIRKKIVEKYDVNWVTLIHPSAQIGTNVKIDKGTVVMAGTVINSGTVVGKGCIVNTAASIDHDNLIEDYVHVSVGAHLAGNVKIGESSWIGIGTVISNNINICNDCMIGAGTVVVKDIEESGTYIGVPARKIHKT